VSEGLARYNRVRRCESNPRSRLRWDGLMTAASVPLRWLTHGREPRGAWGPMPGRMVAVLIMILTAGAPSAVPAAPPGQDGSQFFERNIRPLLVQYCYECHSQQAKKLRGGL